MIQFLEIHAIACTEITFWQTYSEMLQKTHNYTKHRPTLWRYRASLRVNEGSRTPRFNNGSYRQISITYRLPYRQNSLSLITEYRFSLSHRFG